MSEFQVPMGDVPSDYTKLDESKLYVCRITGVEIKKTSPEAKIPGEPMITVVLEVRRPAEWEGKVMYENLLLPIAPTPLDSTAQRRAKLERGVRLRQFMEACELKWGPSGFNTDDWVGAEVGCTVRNQENRNGDMFSSPKKLMSASIAREAIDKAEHGQGPGADGPIAGISSGVQDQGI